ncbi:MAG: hypothetical protein Q9165_008259 [Trypethelium subeluteriae]
MSSEPSCISRKAPESDRKPPDILGVAYRITRAQYTKVIASEGGGIAYKDVELQAVPVEDKDRAKTGDELTVRTLVAKLERSPWPRPSQRYMDIITTGALEAQMPQDYQRYLEAIGVYQGPHKAKTRIGAAIFLALFGPVMQAMEMLTKSSIKPNGYAPRLVIWLVRWTVVMIWVLHDTIFAPIFGRGDGRETAVMAANGEACVIENLPLLEKKALPDLIV